MNQVWVFMCGMTGFVSTTVVAMIIGSFACIPNECMFPTRNTPLCVILIVLSFMGVVGYVGFALGSSMGMACNALFGVKKCEPCEKAVRQT